MCFAPQRRALFRHRNFQKWSDAEVLCTFWLRNVLRATTACNFSSLIWPAGPAPAALASLLFDPPEPQIIGKNSVFCDFRTFSRICIFFLLTLSLLLFFLLIFLFSLPLPCSAFHLSILSEVWLLNFLRSYGHICLITVATFLDKVTTCKFNPENMLRAAMTLDIIGHCKISSEMFQEETARMFQHCVVLWCFNRITTCAPSGEWLTGYSLGTRSIANFWIAQSRRFCAKARRSRSLRQDAGTKSTETSC